MNKAEYILARLAWERFILLGPERRTFSAVDSIIIVQGHSRSLVSVSIKSACATYYTIVTNSNVETAHRMVPAYITTFTPPHSGGNSGCPPTGLNHQYRGSICRYDTSTLQLDRRTELIRRRCSALHRVHHYDKSYACSGLQLCLCSMSDENSLLRRLISDNRISPRNSKTSKIMPYD